MSEVDQSMVDRIRNGCIECGDCWIWQGASAWGKHPQMKIDGHCLSVRRVLWQALHGEIPNGKQISCTCGTRNCVFHIAPQTHGAIAKRMVAKGMNSNPARWAKIAATKRASSVLSDEQVAEIRAGGETLEMAAQKHGITKGYAGRIRRGDARKDYLANPFQGLMP